jgi:pimeloyl-ACP methyl ester carboxylesterase
MKIGHFSSKHTGQPISSATAVLLHGLASHPLALNGIKRRMIQLGFDVYAPRYPSMSANVDQILEFIQLRLDPIPTTASLYFVTHSLGGIIARLLIERLNAPNLARVVMLAPPNHGTEFVDCFRHLALFRAIFGPATLEVGTSPHSLPHRLPPPTFELGIIAGCRALNPLSYWLLPKPNDGIVSVKSTRLEGMSDHITVPYPHRVMLSVPTVIDQVIHFLRFGYFDKNKVKRDEAY